jgi:hypothetical protein
MVEVTRVGKEEDLIVAAEGLVDFEEFDVCIVQKYVR